eukprot:gene40974-54263_t
MRIATWNVNSVRTRLDQVVAWLQQERPEVLCLQETKVTDELFPRAAFEALGYQVVISGQKAYNGVALLSKFPVSDVRRGLPGQDLLTEDAEDQACYIEAVIEAPRPIRVGGIYLPNGNPIGTEKFDFKMRWMARLNAHARDLLALEEPFTLCGDYNVIPLPDDAKNPSAWVNDALFQPGSRAAFRALKGLGLYEAGELGRQPPGTYTFWDYQAGAWQRDHGI